MQRETHCEHDERPALSMAPAGVVERAAALLKAIGDAGRLRLLERLALAGEQCVTELSASSGEGMSTISQRLRLLRAERLVTRRRDGKHIYYALTDQHVKELIFAALEHAAEHTGDPP